MAHIECDARKALKVGDMDRHLLTWLFRGRRASLARRRTLVANGWLEVTEGQDNAGPLRLRRAMFSWCCIQAASHS
jgi:hypothetical protein